MKVPIHFNVPNINKWFKKTDNKGALSPSGSSVQQLSNLFPYTPRQSFSENELSRTMLLNIVEPN